MRAIEFGDLPKYSAWPAILLGLQDFEPKKKTPAEVMREFEAEKWSSVLAAVKGDSSLRVSDLDSLRLASPELALAESGSFYLASAMDAFHAQFGHQVRSISRFMPQDAIVELGAGYGSILIRMALLKEFKRCSFYAAEYTRSGKSALDILAARSGVSVSTGFCDFRTLQLSELAIPPNAIIYTSYAMHYVDPLPTDFPRYFAAMRPACVIHFEPCYEHCDSSTIYGMMCKRYIEINGYNRNLLSILRESRDKGEIDFLAEEVQVMGANPFLPMSIIAWKPRAS